MILQTLVIAGLDQAIHRVRAFYDIRWMRGSRLRQGFAAAFPGWRAEALAEAASSRMTIQ